MQQEQDKKLSSKSVVPPIQPLRKRRKSGSKRSECRLIKTLTWYVVHQQWSLFVRPHQRKEFPRQVETLFFPHPRHLRRRTGPEKEPRFRISSRPPGRMSALRRIGFAPPRGQIVLAEMDCRKT